MTTEERNVVTDLKKHNWLMMRATIAILAFGVVVSHWVMFVLIAAEINKGRCSCKPAVNQTATQNVTVEKPTNREDTIREDLKRKWELNHDVRRVAEPQELERK